MLYLQKFLCILYKSYAHLPVSMKMLPILNLYQMHEIRVLEKNKLF